MRYISTLILCLITINAYAQQNEIEQLLSVQNINVSEISDICTVRAATHGDSLDEGLSLRLTKIQNLSEDTARGTKKVQKIHADLVSINSLNGYTFHVADYYGNFGNSRVVTCLDGDMKGYQGVADNGILQIESNDVKWHKGYFVHKYPNAKVISYPKSQTLEIRVK